MRKNLKKEIAELTIVFIGIKITEDTIINKTRDVYPIHMSKMDGMKRPTCHVVKEGSVSTTADRNMPYVRAEFFPIERHHHKSELLVSVLHPRHGWDRYTKLLTTHPLPDWQEEFQYSEPD